MFFFVFTLKEKFDSVWSSIESATSKEFLLVFLDILRFLNLVLSSIVVDLTYCRLHFFALDL